MKESELDKEGFNAEAYVNGLLERESLSGVLKVEEELIDGMTSRLSRGESKSLLRIGC